MIIIYLLSDRPPVALCPSLPANLIAIEKERASMADTFLKIEQSDKAGVLLVTLARPPVNALSLAFFKEL